MDAPAEGGVGGTYVGNPVAQAAALAVLDVIEEEGLVEPLGRARRDDAGAPRVVAGALAAGRRRARSRARCWRSSSSRTAGRFPATELASRVVDEALARGLLLLKAGVAGNCIRVLVPLVISDAELDEALDVWETLWQPRFRADEPGVGSPPHGRRGVV